MTTGRLRMLEDRAFGALLLATALLLPFASPSYAVATLDTALAPLQAPADDATDLDPETVRRELDSFRAARITLRQAMTIAEALHAGSTTADISFDGAAAQPVYRVKTVQRDRVWRHAINATTGEVMDHQAASPLATLDTEDQSNLLVLRALRHRLSDAVLVAERAAAGKAISGGLTREAGKLNFVIVVVSGADLKQVILEPPRARVR
ncbi:peptidase [Bradyrhizobium sp. LTSP885]|nr:peptidase [Bradyrhizobium sp. LTSP885]